MADITITLPDGSTRRVAAGATAAIWPTPIGSRLAKAAVIAGRRRRSSATSAGRSPTATQVAIVTGRHRRGPPRPAPLDGARAGPGGARPVPRRQVRDRPGDRGRLLLRLRPARRRARSATTTSSASRPRMREIVEADQPFVRDEIADAEALELFADQPYKREIIERVRRPSRRADAGEVGAGGTMQHLPQHRPSSSTCAAGPHVPSHRPARPLQADAGRRRVLARRREGTRCCSASTARRGSRKAGARRAPAPARGGREARPPQARRRARPVQLPGRARRRPRRLAPEGRASSAS